MTGVDKRRQKRLRKTKSRLVDELESLERALTQAKLGGNYGGDAGVDISASTEALMENQGLLLSIIDNSPAAILLKDPEGRYLMANRIWYEWFNPDAEEITGKTVYDFYDKDHSDKVTAMDQKVLETGEAILQEQKIPLATGTVLDGTLRKFPIFDSDGKIIAIGGLHFDISGIRHTEEALRQSEGRLQEALESLYLAFALYDADDRLIAFNDEYERIRPGAGEVMANGGTFEDLIRNIVEKGFISEAFGREEEFIRERVKEHHNPKGTFIRKLKDGTWSRVEEVKTPSGGVALSFIDITELKEAEEALGKSEALFRTMVNHSPTKIHIKDVEGRYTLISKEAEKLFGITDEEGRGKTSYDLFPKEEADAFTAHDKAVIESGKSLENEEEFMIDGELRTYLTVKFPIYDLEGVAGVGAIGTDITERKRAEETNTRLGRIIEESLNEIYLFDRETLGFIQVNPGALNNLGYTMEEMQRMTPMDIKPEFSREDFSKLIEPLKDASHDHIVFETVHQRKDGSTYDVEVHLQLMRDDKHPFFYAIIQDISERKRAEAEILAAKEQAEYANRTKTEFLANMSHELRTPLNSILGFSEILTRETLGPHGNFKYLEYAEDIHSSGTHLLGLIGEVLDLSKLEVGELGLNESEIDVAETINICVKMIEGRSFEKKVSLNSQVSSGLPRLFADELRFKQILLNLLGNAVKFTPTSGEVTLSVEVSKDGEMVIEVSDTGLGIAEHDIPKVLEPFGQVHDVMTRNHEGSGLGLHLAKSFTEIHGGTLEIESILGQGTAVILTFPKERTIRPGQKKSG